MGRAISGVRVRLGQEGARYTFLRCGLVGGLELVPDLAGVLLYNDAQPESATKYYLITRLTTNAS